MNRNGLIAMIVVAVLVLGGGAYFLTRDSSTNKTNNSNSSMNEMDMSKSDDSGSGSESSTPEATDTVIIDDFAFSPANITVKKGTKVTWTNQDSVGHTVTETDGKTGPDSELLAKGDSYSFTFDTVGTFAYDCTPHPYMKGTVTVTE